MEMLIALVALLVAVWQLQLQRRETRLNGKLNSLLHMATLIKDRIDLHEQIINHMKLKKEDYRPNAQRVNTVLKPLLKKINHELVLSIARYRSDLDVEEIRQALNMADLD